LASPNTVTPHKFSPGLFEHFGHFALSEHEDEFSLRAFVDSKSNMASPLIQLIDADPGNLRGVSRNAG
jgi:hypothetical protein